MLNLDEFYNTPCDNVLIILDDPQTCDEGRLMDFSRITVKMFRVETLQDQD